MPDQPLAMKGRVAGKIAPDRLALNVIKISLDFNPSVGPFSEVRA
jgi:hypothetical protein